MNQIKPRHELKYNISLSDALALKARLKAITHADPHGGAINSYKIRSLYFDNLQDKALMEKINGVNNREKFRLRYYNNDPSFIKLEKKSKRNGLCYKEFTLITKEECEKLLQGDYSFLKNQNNRLFTEFYAKIRNYQLRAKTIVDYLREPYIYKAGNVRITLDSHITTGLFSTDFFKSDIPTINHSYSDVIILEVKYDEFLPGIIQDLIQLNNRQSSAFSKYAACRIYG